jgi:hypothetical protein
MPTKTYRGSCHCGAVRFEADLDLSRGTGKCNCTQCWKARGWGIGIKPDAFRLLAGRDELTDYTVSGMAHSVFCKRCGIRPYGWGNIPEIGGEYVSVNVAALDDLDPAELVSAPLRYMDGRHDNWWNPPPETRHL